jgi:hypothetical protein
MGVGRPQDLVDGVALGIDMFDCVIPTRHARSGTLYTFQGRIRITHARYRRDAYPIDTSCDCYTCKHFSRAYLHHLFEIGEILGATLSTIHNLAFFGHLMARMRAAIENGTFPSFRDDIHALYPEKPGEREDHDDDFREARERMAAPRSWSHEPAVRPSKPARHAAPAHPSQAARQAPSTPSAPSAHKGAAAQPVKPKVTHGGKAPRSNAPPAPAPRGPKGTSGKGR